MSTDTPTVAWQASLLAGADTRWDADFSATVRHQLTEGAWVDHQPGWLDGSDALFDRLVHTAGWMQQDLRMYGEVVTQPRLTVQWSVGAVPPQLQELDDLAATLSGRYGIAFTRVGCNLYRDGRDSVAWHGDRVARTLPQATVAIVSVGHRRPFRLRPRAGGETRGFELGRGDLLVMGGSCQRTWRHAVPKVRDAGPRISVTFRHDYAA